MKTRLIFSLLLLSLACAAQTTQWFYVSNGATHCSGSTVVNVTVKISYYCANANESVGGSYTAATFQAMGVFPIGLNNPQQGGGLTCMIGVNATMNQITTPPFGLILPHDAAYQCSSTQGGPAPQVWTGVGVAKQATKGAKK